MTISLFPKSRSRRVLSLLTLLLGLVVLISQLSRLHSVEWIEKDDFVEYWSAARLNLTGGDPYSPEQMESLQREMGRTKNIPLMMYNPPWTLVLFMPLALLPYPVSRLLWLLVNVTLILACITWLWRSYGGSKKFQWIAWLVGFTFYPVIEVLSIGQVGGLLFCSLVGFLYFQEREKTMLAGTAIALSTVKPHVLYLVLLTILLWSVNRQKWTLLAGLGVAVAIGICIAWVINPAVIRQWLSAMVDTGPRSWNTPTLGGRMRVWLGPEKFWLQFVPPTLGAIWLFIYFHRRHQRWQWREQLPLLSAVSVATAAYGWVFDQTVISLAILQVAVRIFMVRSLLTWSPCLIGILAAYGTLNAIAFLDFPWHWFWWLAPCFSGWYLVARKQLSMKGGSIAT